MARLAVGADVIILVFINKCAETYKVQDMRKN